MRLIRINGYRMKDGKLVRNMNRLDVLARLRQRASKRVRVARPIEQVNDGGYRCPDTPDMFGDRIGTDRVMSLEADAVDAESAQRTVAEYRNFYDKEKARRREAGY
jgi:hypothetical protein